MTIKLESLRVFRTVAERGSLAAAAKELNRTPSAISMTLAQLTEHIGSALFETDRKNQLTPLGKLVLQECHRATETFDRCTSAIERHVLSTAGTVRIAAVPSAAASLLPRVIHAFQEEHANVRLEVSDADSAEIKRRVHTDEADIGIISAATPIVVNDDIILRDALGIVYSKKGAIAASLRNSAQTASWDLLSLEPLITNPLCAMVEHPCVKTQLAQSTLRANNITGLLAYIQKGLGATILPLNALTGGSADVDFVSPADPAAHRLLIRIRRKNAMQSEVCEEFWQRLAS